MAETHAMVSLVQGGYADQNDIARVFGYSTRTLRRCQRRYEHRGMSALGGTAGRPHETPSAPSPWVKMAVALKKAGHSVREVAQRLGVSKSAVSKWIIRVSKPASARTHGRAESESESAKKPNSARNNKILRDSGLGVDLDPENRMLNRLLARLGKLMDAEPIFASGKRIPHAGVLLAVPALMESGIFSAADEVYGHIGPAFYGLRTTMMTLLLMALLRIKRPEALKEHAPVDLGRVLGLDRAPEVKTMRRKLSRLAKLGKAEECGRKLADRRVASRGKALGFLYADGHVRVYNGQRRLPKAHVTRMRLSLPATTDYWVNDEQGDPLFVVTADLNAGLVKMLPILLEEVRRLVGPRRKITIVFDRGGWSPKLFKKLIAAGFHILTYRKGRWRKIPETRFRQRTTTVEGRRVSYKLNDRNIRLLKGGLRLRQITRLSGDGHQTAIVTSHKNLSAVMAAYRMFARWRQENFFKYLGEEYALDALVDYDVEQEDADLTVPNPERRKIEKKLAKMRAELRKAQAQYGEAAAANRETKRRTIRGFKIAHGKLGRGIREIQDKIAAVIEKRQQMPKRLPVREVPGKPIVRLSRERKHLTDCIKMVAYQAESDLRALLRPHYKRVDDEGRTLVTSALQSAADLEVQDSELRVTLAPLSSPHRSRAIADMCEVLNRMEMRFPGTQLRLRYAVAS